MQFQGRKHLGPPTEPLDDLSPLMAGLGANRQVIGKWLENCWRIVRSVDFMNNVLPKRGYQISTNTFHGSLVKIIDPHYVFYSVETPIQKQSTDEVTTPSLILLGRPQGPKATTTST